jgi:enoyl-CoA hydratase/carnithine racemase
VTRTGKNIADASRGKPASFSEIRYERPSERLARIVLDRLHKRNAQNMKMLYEINAALDLATQDDQVRVIIIAAAGPHFSSGHDLADLDSRVGDFGAPVGGRGRAPFPDPKVTFHRKRKSTLAFAGVGETSRSLRSCRCKVRLLAGGLC